jgi:hypothetical protein
MPWTQAFIDTGLLVSLVGVIGVGFYALVRYVAG